MLVCLFSALVTCWVLIYTRTNKRQVTWPEQAQHVECLISHWWQTFQNDALRSRQTEHIQRLTDCIPLTTCAARHRISLLRSRPDDSSLIRIASVYWNVDVRYLRCRQYGQPHCFSGSGNSRSRRWRSVGGNDAARQGITTGQKIISRHRSILSSDLLGWKVRATSFSI